MATQLVSVGAGIWCLGFASRSAWLSCTSSQWRVLTWVPWRLEPHISSELGKCSEELTAEKRRVWTGPQTPSEPVLVTFQVPDGETEILLGSRACSDPRMPAAAPVLWQLGIAGDAGLGKERREDRGSAPESRPRVQLPALRSERSAPAEARACGRGATNSQAWRSSPFFAADPGKGGRLGGGTEKGGDSLPRARGGLAPLPAGSSGGAEAQRRAPARAESPARIARVGTVERRAEPGCPRGPMRRVGRWPRRA